uniref:Ras-related protein Rab n=1 Tax=Macrostomum lignano TaxID=282301 RepID=A0A1I8F6B4_9PLAT
TASDAFGSPAVVGIVGLAAIYDEDVELVVVDDAGGNSSSESSSSSEHEDGSSTEGEGGGRHGRRGQRRAAGLLGRQRRWSACLKSSLSATARWEKLPLFNATLNDVFRQDYKSTIWCGFRFESGENGQTLRTIKLQMWDIAGQERFTSMTRVYYKDANAAIVMFDLTRKNTFHSALKWKRDLDSKCSLSRWQFPCLPFCWLTNATCRGAKVDQVTALGQPSRVSVAGPAFQSRGRGLLPREHEFIGWTETSAKEGVMVDEAMRFLIEAVLAKSSRLGDSGEGADGDGSGNGAGTIKLERSYRQDSDGASRSGFLTVCTASASFLTCAWHSSSSAAVTPPPGAGAAPVLGAPILARSRSSSLFNSSTALARSDTSADRLERRSSRTVPTSERWWSSAGVGG